MKKNYFYVFRDRRMLKKTVLIVKLWVFLSLFCLASLHAQTGLSQKVKLNLKNATLSEVFMAIQDQSPMNFLYSNELVKKIARQDIVIEASLEEVLKKCLEGTGLVYEFNEDNIILIKEKNASSKKIQQKFVVSGKVVDEQNIPLPGATVLIKGTTKGTTTDSNGDYTIKVPEGTVLVFSFVGFHKQEVSVSENTEVNVIMEQKAAELGEVAVISTGYQLIKPEQSTGSVATMRAKEYDSRINTTDFLTCLENRIPGLLINNDIEFDGNSLFQIRGISTINGSKQPLIVVDGYPTELSLDMINPNEIESVTVLKDAAAATVYGVRASNGVIVIERKKAKSGKPLINFRATASFTPKENYDRYRWDKDASNTIINYDRLYYNEYRMTPWDWYDIIDPMWGSLYDYPATGLIIAQQLAGVISPEEADQQFEELASYNNTKDYGRLFLRTAVTQTYNLDISGGNENALYYVTANYTASDLSQIKNDNSRFMLSARSTVNFSKRFSMELTTDFQEIKTTSVPVPDINSVYPYEHFEDEDGNPLPVFNSYNGSITNSYYNDAIMSVGLLDNMYYPLVDINEVSDKTHTVNNRITANFRYKIENGFTFNFGGVYESSHTDIKHLASENSSEVHQYINLYAKEGSNGITFNIPEGGFLQQQKTSRESYTLRAQLNYDKQISKDHSLNLILGGEIRDVLDKSNTASYFGYNDQTLLHQAVDYKTLLGSSFRPTFADGNPRLFYDNLFNQGYEDNRYVSIYSNVVYAYKGKYSATGSIRIDQSNLFGTDPKYKYKPLWSIGAGWNIHKENFMQDANWVKSLKLRIAYGFNGNVAKNVLPQVIGEAALNKFYSTSIIPSIELLSYANSGLRWEQTRNFNIGLDYSIFRSISGSIDYYIKKSTDILAMNQIDASKGGSFAIINQASVRNSGLEISLQADWISRKNFNWNTGLVLSYNSSKVLDVYNDKLTAESDGRSYVRGSYSDYVDGYAVGAIFSYRYAGLDSEGGFLIYNGNGEAEAFSYNTDKSYVDYSGSSIPSFNMGLSNRVDIGNFYVYCMINYYGGFKVKMPVPTAGNMRPLEGANNYWREPGDEADPDMLPSPTYVRVSHLAYTDKYTVNGSYFTLGDLTASYSFRDSKWLKKTGISNLEVRLQAHNLFTVGLNDYNYSVATGSYDKSYLTPTYTVGLYVNF